MRVDLRNLLKRIVESLSKLDEEDDTVQDLIRDITILALIIEDIDNGSRTANGVSGNKRPRTTSAERDKKPRARRSKRN